MKVKTVKVPIIIYSILIFILITFISVLFLNFWGLVLFRDIDFLLGAIIGVIFALKNRKPDQ
ncbi:hypothetical protein LCGC14_3020440, partial [marine sediment metagenome]